MAGRIEGITINIDGNVTPLKKALSSVDGSIRKLKTGIRDVDRLLKFNPASTTLITQKQQLLRQAISQTKDRLATLNQAMAEMDAKGVDHNSEEYQRLQREIIATEQELTRLEREYSKVASVAGVQLQAMGAQFQELGRKISDVGQSITKSVTVPLAAIGAASIAAFKGVDKGMDIIVAKTGASGDALENMKDIAKSLATEIPTDFETAGAAVGEVNTRFGLTGQSLEELSGKFVKFAQLNQTDVSTSVDTVQKALSAFGLDASKAGALLDTLTLTGQQTGVSMDTLMSGLVQNGTAFQELGLNIEQSTALMGQFEKSGANSETVMQGMRKALKNAAKDGKPLNEALSELQDTILNGKDGMDGLTAAYDLFGKSGDQIYGAVKNGTIDFANLGAAAADASGTLERTFENTLDPVDEFKLAMNNLKIAGADLGKSLLGVITPAIKKLSSIIDSAKKKWTSLSDAQKQNVVKLGLVAAAIGPVITIVGKLVSGLGGIMSAAGTALNGITALAKGTAVFSAGPAAAALLVAAGLATGLYAMAKSSRDAARAEHDLSEEEQKHIDVLNEASSAYEEADKARVKATESIVADAEHSKALVSEYNSLIDANGKVKEGYESRAEFIKSTLAESLGLEKSQIDELIGANGQLKDQIYDLIEAKKAEAILDANKDTYAQAIQERRSAVEKLGPALRDLQSAEAEVQSTSAELAKRQQEYNNYVENGGRHTAQYAQRLEAAKLANEGAVEGYNKAKDAVAGYEETLNKANSEIANYEGLAAALASKDAAAMEQYMANLTTGIKTRADATQQELEEQARIITEEYELIKAAYESGQAGITADMVDAAKARMDAANTEAGSVGQSAAAENSAITTNLSSANTNANKSFQGIQNGASTYMAGASRAVTDNASAIKSNFPINLGQLFTGTLTTIAAKIKEAAGEKSVSYTTGVQRFAKAYENPYIFTAPTILTGDRGAYKGGEMMYSKDNLMRDIQEAANPIKPAELYEIILAAVDKADLRVEISGREFGRIVRGVS